MRGKRIRPKVIDYENYRKFIEDWYQHLRATAPSAISFRTFSINAGFRSHVSLRRVIDGGRNLSSKSAEKLHLAMRLSRPEAEYFLNLVFLNQAKTLAERKFFADRIIHLSIYRNANPLRKAQYEYYTYWYYVAIRELVAIGDFQENPEWISGQLTPSVTVAQVERALKQLQKLGFIKRDAKGRLTQADPVLVTDGEVFSPLISEFHRTMIEKGGESIERFDRSHREVSCVTVGLSRQAMTEARKLIRRCQTDILNLTESENKPDGVYQVNFQLFPLSLPQETKSKKGKGEKK